MRLRARVLVTVLVAAIVPLAACERDNDVVISSSGEAAVAEGATAEVELPSGMVVSLPVVDGEDPANPISGTQSNTDPRTPPVRGDGQHKQVVGSWSGLNDVRGGDAAYTLCANVRIGFNWGTDVPKFIQTEQTVRPDGSHFGTRYILAVNTTASDAQVREVAKKDAPDLPGDAAIVRVNGFINTRGFNSGSCDAFWDRRSMVRVSLGVVLYDAHGNPIGLDADPKGSRARGIFVDCHNPWMLARVRKVIPPPAPPKGNNPTPMSEKPKDKPKATTTVPAEATTTTVPRTTTTVPCLSGKCTSPTTTPAPPTTAPPPPTTPTTLQDNDSGDGWWHTIPPVEVPATTMPPAPPPPVTAPTIRVVV